MIALAAAVSLVLAAPAGPPTLRTAAEIPGDAKVDGELGEWAASPPTFLLGPGNQVAGPVKASSAADFSARVWIAWSESGLTIAGEVTDDVVRFAEGSAPNATADHVEVWLSLPAAQMPPIAFVNQFAEEEIAGAKECATKEGIEDVKACEAWFAAQVSLRARLERAFTRQYLVSPSGVAETWSTPKESAALAGLACCARTRAVVKAGAPGWRFEILIPPEDFPPTGQLPLRDARVMVDVVDADDGITKLESFFSSSTVRKFGKPETFHSVPLPAPRSFDAVPPLLADLMKARPAVAYQPGTPVPRAWSFENRPRGYQYQPEEPSPAVTTFTLGKLKPIAESPELRVYETPIGIRAVKREKVAGTIQAPGRIVGQVVRRGHVHLLFHEETTMHPLGTGACGACPMHVLTMIGIDDEGGAKTLIEESVVEDSPVEENGRSFSRQDVEVFFEKDLSAFGFRGKKMGEEQTTPFVMRWKWDAITRSYVLEGSS